MVIVMCATLVGLAVEDVLNPRSRHVPVGWRLLMARRIPLRGEDPAEDPAAELEEERG
jgi:hypothetical protein